jgi:hypothetical protein
MKQDGVFCGYGNGQSGAGSGSAAGGAIVGGYTGAPAAPSAPGAPVVGSPAAPAPVAPGAPPALGAPGIPPQGAVIVGGGAGVIVVPGSNGTSTQYATTTSAAYKPQVTSGASELKSSLAMVAVMAAGVAAQFWKSSSIVSSWNFLVSNLNLFFLISPYLFYIIKFAYILVFLFNTYLNDASIGRRKCESCKFYTLLNVKIFIH